MFSVKRPLRFLIHKLDLSDEQAMQVAEALSDFRLERDQADIERRRAKKTLTAALKSDAFDRTKADEALDEQLDAQRDLFEAFVDAIERIHAILDEGQREKLAYLLGSLDLEI